MAGITQDSYYRGDIQGLRGLAVWLVIIYHAAPQQLPGGYVGVDVFFVISGFVMTSLIQRDLNKNSFSLRGFYSRRIIRLFPALFAMLSATLLAGACILSPRDLRELGRTTISTVFFASNIDFNLILGYFNSESTLKPLLHTWSLAVEEQFYLFFPLVLILAWRCIPNKIPALFATIMVFSFGLEIWLTRTRPQAAFYLSPSRSFEFCIGATLAWASGKTSSSKNLENVCALAGLAIIAFSALRFNEATVFPGVNALFPCLGAALLINAGPTTLLGKVLGSFVPKTLGDASYSLYLWHWPVVFVRHLCLGSVPFALTFVVLVVSLVLGLLSRRFVEKPFLVAKISQRLVFQKASVVIALFAALGSAVYFSRGWPQRFSPEVLRL